MWPSLLIPNGDIAWRHLHDGHVSGKRETRERETETCVSGVPQRRSQTAPTVRKILIPTGTPENKSRNHHLQVHTFWQQRTPTATWNLVGHGRPRSTTTTVYYHACCFDWIWEWCTAIKTGSASAGWTNTRRVFKGKSTTENLPWFKHCMHIHSYSTCRVHEIYLLINISWVLYKKLTYLSVCLSTWMPVGLHIWVSPCMFSRLSVCLSIHPSTHLSYDGIKQSIILSKYESVCFCLCYIVQEYLWQLQMWVTNKKIIIFWLYGIKTPSRCKR